MKTMIVTALVFAFLGQTRVQAKIELKDPIKWQNFYDVWTAVRKKYPDIKRTDEDIFNMFAKMSLFSSSQWDAYITIDLSKEIKDNPKYKDVKSEMLSALNNLTLDNFNDYIKKSSKVTTKNYNDLIKEDWASKLYERIEAVNKSCHTTKNQTNRMHFTPTKTCTKLPILWSHVINAIQNSSELTRIYITEFASVYYSRLFIGPMKNLRLEECAKKAIDGRGSEKADRKCFGIPESI